MWCSWVWASVFLFCVMGPTELTTWVCCVNQIRQVTWHTQGTQPICCFVLFCSVLFGIKEMSQARTGRLALWHCGWSQSNFRRMKVKCIPNNYQRCFTKLPYLEFTWVHSYCSKTCDFRTFFKIWRSLDYNDYFLISHMFFSPKRGMENTRQWYFRN